MWWYMQDPEKEFPNREEDGLTKVSPGEIKQAQKDEKAGELLKGTMLKRMDFLELE